MTIIWREQMSVGNALIDNEHKYLLEQVNAVEKAINTEKNYDILVKTLDHLVDYTKTHFEHEEKIQAKIHFRELEGHKKEHGKIMAELFAIRKQLLATLGIHQEQKYHEANEAIINDSEFFLSTYDSPQQSISKSELQPLADLVRKWIVNHVIGSDMKLKPYLTKLPSGFK